MTGLVCRLSHICRCRCPAAAAAVLLLLPLFCCCRRYPAAAAAAILMLLLLSFQRRKELKHKLGLPEDYGVQDSDEDEGAWQPQHTDQASL
jgi:hypothetical protein